MADYKINKLPKKTTEVTATLPWANVNKAVENAFTTLSQKVTAPGYRPGKAPKEIAQKYISQDALYEEGLKGMLPQIYEDIIKSQNLRPVVNPKIDLVSAKDKEDWQVKFTIAEAPEVVLGDYKKKIEEVKKTGKKEDIWVPGKGEPKDKPQEDENAKRQRMLNEILDTLLKNIKVEISDLILEEELNQRLSKLVEDVHKLGLTLENYLKSRNTTIEAIKEGYKTEVENTFILEFILGKIAEEEKITVEQEELDKLFSAIQDEKERAQAKATSYWYATILRKQKTLDFLTSL